MERRRKRRPVPGNDVSTLSVHDPQRANHLLMLECGDRADFDDPKLEYRRMFSELLGTDGFVSLLDLVDVGLVRAWTSWSRS
jgi:hypothetical protein